MDFPRLSNLQRIPEHYPVYDFSNTILVAIQHFLGTNGSLFELLHELGLPYGQMYLLGKIYSTNEAVYDEMRHRGAYVHPASIRLDVAQLTIDYKMGLAQAADELLTEAISKLDHLTAPKTLLVVDDGGVLICRANGRASKINARIVGVEQTRSGAEALRAVAELNFPIVNVAESSAKLQGERSPGDHAATPARRASRGVRRP